MTGVLVASDQQGKHKNRPHAVSEETKQKIREHINTFPHRKSHYSRSDNRKREYLNEGLSISRMHMLYLEKYEPLVKQTRAKPEVKDWVTVKAGTQEHGTEITCKCARNKCKMMNAHAHIVKVHMVIPVGATT